MSRSGKAYAMACFVVLAAMMFLAALGYAVQLVASLVPQ